MVATMDAASAARLARLFAAPSKQGMLELDWAEFEDFVQHVFECAGYAVEKVSSRPKHNVDLVLHAGHIEGKVVARVEVRRYQTARLPRARIWQFHGALLGQGNAPGYIVTTSEFTKPAYDAAEATHGKVKLINGDRLIRYIRYVSGSRLTSANGATASLHQPVIAPDYLLDAEAIPRRSPAQTTILAVANNKGGVAKTTTALNVALVLTLKHKQRVLLVDMDGQHSLTKLLPLPLPLPLPARPRGRRPANATEPPPVDAAFLADYFTDDRALPELVRATRFDRLSLIPADHRLTQLDLTTGSLPGKLLEFMRDLHHPALVSPDGTAFDWIILDTPPAQALCTRAALAACHFVLLPACAETLAVSGADGGLSTIRTMRALTGDNAGLVGGIITRWKVSGPANQALVGLTDLLRQHNSRLLTTKIPEDSRIERGLAGTADGGIRHLFRLALGPAARAYEALVKEILPYVQRG